MGTPCFITFSLSTSAKICGTEGEKLGMMFCSSGRLRAASTKRLTFSVRNFKVPPLRSCRNMLKPPAELMPGMAGGSNANTRASAIFANSPLSFPTMALAVRSGRSRSAHGLKPMNAVPP